MQGFQLPSQTPTFKTDLRHRHRYFPLFSACRLSFERLAIHPLLLPRPLFALSYHSESYVSLCHDEFEFARCNKIRNLNQILILESLAFISTLNGELRVLSFHPHSSTTDKSVGIKSPLFYENSPLHLAPGECLNTLFSLGFQEEYQLYLHDIRIKRPVLRPVLCRTNPPIGEDIDIVFFEQLEGRHTILLSDEQDQEETLYMFL